MSNQIGYYSIYVSYRDDCLSIPWLIEQELAQAMSLSGFSLEKPPQLYRLRDVSKVVYRCAIAFPLASVYQLPPLAIAQDLLKFLPREKLSQDTLEFTLTLVKDGWLDFQLRDHSLAVWLNKLKQLPQIKPQIKGLFSPQATTESVVNLFPVQYVHARCCSWLRNGVEDGLISSYLPDSTPWLNDNGKFQLVHPSEIYLINQFVDIVAKLWTDDQNWLKLVFNLSQAVLEFHESCQIWGEVKQKQPSLAQARLGLIALSQLLLNLLLENQWGVAAIVEL